MRVGLVARGDHAGLAAMSRELFRHLEPARTLLVDIGAQGRGAAHREWYPGAEVASVTWRGGRHGHREGIPAPAVRRLLAGVDVVVGVETWYSDDLPGLAARAGVATVLIVMPELYRCDRADHLWLPTTWEAGRLPGARVVPFPVARDRLPYRERTGAATFLHLAGDAFHDRNGTKLVLAACRHVRTPVRLLVSGPARLPARIGVVTVEELGRDTPDYWDAYPADADVLLMPRRYAGQSLPMVEAASLGMPVLSLDVEPQRRWLPGEAVIPARARQRVAMGTLGAFAVHDADPRALARVIDRLAGDPALVGRLSEASDGFAESVSWARLLPEYRRLLTEVVDAGPHARGRRR